MVPSNGCVMIYLLGADNQVIYRELRDFFQLHAHYKAANVGTSVAGLRTSRKVEIPDFPKMSE